MAITSLLDRVPIEIRHNIYRFLKEDGHPLYPYDEGIVPGLVPFVKTPVDLMDNILETFGKVVVDEINRELFRHKTCTVMIAESLESDAVPSGRTAWNWFCGALLNANPQHGNYIWPITKHPRDQCTSLLLAPTLHISIELKIPYSLESTMCERAPVPDLILRSLCFLARMLPLNRSLAHLCVHIQYRTGIDHESRRLRPAIAFVADQLRLFGERVPAFRGAQISTYPAPVSARQKPMRNRVSAAGRLPRRVLVAFSEWSNRLDALRFEDARVCCFGTAESVMYSRSKKVDPLKVDPLKVDPALPEQSEQPEQ